MQTFTLLESASVIRRVHVETMRIERVHLDVRDLTDTVYEQVSPLHSLVERAEHGTLKWVSAPERPHAERPHAERPQGRRRP